MPRAFLFTLLLTLTMLSCKKYNGTNSTLIGKWELRASEGGYPFHIQSFPPGNQTFIVFTDTLYQSYARGTVVSQGRYTLSRGVFSGTGREMDAFTVNNMQIFYEISGNTMTIYVGIVAADGVINKYVRL